MIKILESGFDLVSGWKIRRLDPWHKTWPSKLFNLTVSAVCGQRLHDFNCGIKAYRSCVVRYIELYGDYHRFIPVMAKWQGFRITEMPVAHRARVHGVSKYGVSRLVSGFLDLVSLVFMRRCSGSAFAATLATNGSKPARCMCVRSCWPAVSRWSWASSSVPSGFWAR